MSVIVLAHLFTFLGHFEELLYFVRLAWATEQESGGRMKRRQRVRARGRKEGVEGGAAERGGEGGRGETWDGERQKKGTGFQLSPASASPVAGNRHGPPH